METVAEIRETLETEDQAIEAELVALEYEIEHLLMKKERLEARHKAILEESYSIRNVVDTTPDEEED